MRTDFEEESCRVDSDETTENYRQLDADLANVLPVGLAMLGLAGCELGSNWTHASA
jgi:hypothetical protein